MMQGNLTVCLRFVDQHEIQPIANYIIKYQQHFTDPITQKDDVDRYLQNKIGIEFRRSNYRIEFILELFSVYHRRKFSFYSTDLIEDGNLCWNLPVSNHRRKTVLDADLINNNKNWNGSMSNRRTKPILESFSV